MLSWDGLVGHAYTLGPFLKRKVFEPRVPSVEKLRFDLVDSVVGHVELTGELLSRNTKALLIVVHGLGGNTESGYMKATLTGAAHIDADILLLNLRGADRRGYDFNHAGLVADLEAALRHPRLEHAERVFLLGYSLGGHLALSYAAGRPDPRVCSVAAISSPLDLSASADAFDEPGFSVYRRHVMESLYQIYTCAYQRNPSGIVPHEARKIDKIRTWDSKVVAPRYGFQSAEHYYRDVSVGPRLGALRVPALYVGAIHDPMVPPAAAAAIAPQLDAVWVRRGGHLGFPHDLDLGLPGPLGLVPQVLRWLSAPGLRARGPGLSSR
jgi:uncharacterized protein